MTTPRQHADLAVRYFMDNTTNCWARNEGSNNEWTLMPDPRFNVPGLEYYVGHEPPPPDKHTIDNLRAQLAEAQAMGAGTADELTTLAALHLLKELVAALDETYWSSWQTTAKFDNQLTHARNFVAELEGRDE